LTNDQKKWKYLKDYIFRKLINWSKKFLNFTLLTQDEGKLIKWENIEKQLKEMNLIWNDTLRSPQEDDDMILLLSGSDIISKLEFCQWNISPVVMMITHIRKICKLEYFISDSLIQSFSEVILTSINEVIMILILKRQWYT
jgi:hypothetical protein